MAKTVRKNEATHIAPARLKRVSAYARRAMETDRLNHLLSAQVSYYSELIQKHPGWVYAGASPTMASRARSPTGRNSSECFPKILNWNAAHHHTPLIFSSLPSHKMNVSPSPTIILSTSAMNSSVLSTFSSSESYFRVSMKGSACLTRYACSCRSAATALNLSSIRR